MNGQKKISAFFTAKSASAYNATTKRSVLSQVQESEPPKKSAKLEQLRTNSFELMHRPSIGKSWNNALHLDMQKPYFLELERFVKQERTKAIVYPPPELVYSWTQHSHIRNTKVVILGQDPYHGPKQAHGLCFSVQRGIRHPPSLVNMFKELEKDIKGFQIPEHGDLTGWANQGVLLLNAVLTVQASKPNSHKDKGWEKFTDAVISWLNANLSGVVFMLWGSYAQKKGSKINSKKHHILKAVHPSPLSAHRGFFGCGHFSKANQYLKETGKSPIDWSAL